MKRNLPHALYVFNTPISIGHNVKVIYASLFADILNQESAIFFTPRTAVKKHDWQPVECAMIDGFAWGRCAIPASTAGKTRRQKTVNLLALMT